MLRSGLILKIQNKYTSLRLNDVENIVDLFFKKIFLALQNNQNIEIRNFGIFEVKPTKAKPKARNPKTNEIIYVPPRRKISFKASKKLNKKLKKEWRVE